MSDRNGDMEPCDDGLIRQAMALRVKHRKPQKQNVPLSVLGVHQMNRGGVCPMSETVTKLGLKIVAGGFSKEEANHQGVCVEEPPVGTFEKCPWDKSQSYETLFAFNTKHTSAVAELSSCFQGTGWIAYGTLSHSHLLLILLSLQNGAKWVIPEDATEQEKQLAQLQDYNGRWNPTAVAAKDSELAEVLRRG